MNEAQLMWEAYHKHLAELAEKYIGKQVIERRDELDPYHKRMWYINRIKDLMRSKGICDDRIRRCKYDSPTYKFYNVRGQELEHLADNLAMDLMDLMIEQAGKMNLPNA